MAGSNTSMSYLNGTELNQTTTVAPSSSTSSIVILMLITVPGVICNLVALIFIVRDVRKAVFPAIILLLALCCADLLAISLSALRHMLMYLVTEMTYGMCASLSIINSFFRVFAGILNAMMAIDRVMAISMPFYYKRKVDVRRWKIGCLVAAAGTALFTLLPIAGLGSVMVTVERAGRQRTICTTFSYQEEARLNVYGYMYILVGYAITLTIVIGNVIVVRSIMKLKNKIVNVGPLETSTSSNADNPSKTNSTSFEVAFAKLMGCLAAVYLFMGTPYYTLTLLQLLNKPVERTAVTVIHLISGLSYSIDPIVYILIRKINRKKVMNFLFRCCKNEVSTM